MKKKIKAIAIIPARGGSKGLPGKNMMNLAGKPLIEWAIDSSLASRHIQHTVLSSDDEDILSFARCERLETISRPRDLAQDDSRTEPVMLHALQHMRFNAEGFDYVVLLQPTSPLRTALQIDRALEQVVRHQAQGLISVVEPRHHPFKMFIEDQGYLKAAFDDDFPFMPRQALPTAYAANGAIYIIRTDLFLSSHALLQPQTIPFLMDETSSIDIDSIEDLKRAEFAMKHEIKGAGAESGLTDE